MNHILSKTYNLDSIIQDLQTRLYNHLVIKWGTDKIDAYGRVYKNEKEGKTIPEVYNATAKGYKEVLYNGQSCFFFVDDDNHPCIDNDHEFTTNVKLCFMLNLDDIKAETERVDEDVKKDVVTFLSVNDYQFRMNGYIKGIDNVFREFDTHKIKNNYMHPLHVFAIETEFSYSVI